MTALIERRPAHDTAGARGVIGGRVLVAVQTFDIARLTTHPLPVIPGTFIAVSGVGPQSDSNGSGKTSFLAAVTVLLADPQWRLDVNGGQLAAGLLFRPDPAGVNSDTFASASHGYIVGVFTDPGALAVTDRGAVEASAVTVWVRLSATSPHLQVRWAHGMHVAAADSDEERYQQADTIWAGLPASNRLSARAMREALYGDAPRCMAYLDTPLRRVAASLLSQQMTEMTPDAIGASLIELAGLRHLFESEQEQRNELAGQQRALGDAVAAHEQRVREEDTELNAVMGRNEARERLADGERYWRLHYARGLVDLVPRWETMHGEAEALEQEIPEARDKARGLLVVASNLAARTDLPDAERTAREVRDRARHAREENASRRQSAADARTRNAGERHRLRAAADGWDGTSSAVTAAAVTAALEAKLSVTLTAKAAHEDVAAAGAALEDARAGRSADTSAALYALSAAGVSAVGLADVVTLADHARAEWEPRLWPWRSSVVVGAGDTDHAAQVLSAISGAIVVTADGRVGGGATDDGAVEHTTGGDNPGDLGLVLANAVSTQVDLTTFLMAVASRAEYVPGPDRAVDSDAATMVVGGFDIPFTGRAARIVAAQAVLTDAETAAADADRDVVRASRAHEFAQNAHDTADAGERVAELDEADAVLAAQVAVCDERAGELDAAERAADDEWQAAFLVASNHKSEIDKARRAADDANNALTALKVKAREARTAVENLNLVYWQSGWGDSVEAAEAYLAANAEQGVVPGEVRLRNLAQEALRDAVLAYRRGNPDPPADIQAILERREELDDSAMSGNRSGLGRGGSGRLPTFADVARPLKVRLDGTVDHDTITVTRIHGDRARREVTIAELEVEVTKRTGTLEALQDMIEASVEGHFQRMSDALGRLDAARGGHGAELAVVSIRPVAATSMWKWEVTPRWRRSATTAPVSYREVANGAQIKVYAVQVTLAALLAAEDAAGRVLVIDELGNSLGEVNRKDVLNALRSVAEHQQVTIIGTCQDSVLADASDACAEVLWFTHASTADAYNQPTRVWGHDTAAGRVVFLADWLRSGRPAL